MSSSQVVGSGPISQLSANPPRLLFAVAACEQVAGGTQRLAAHCTCLVAQDDACIVAADGHCRHARAHDSDGRGEGVAHVQVSPCNQAQAVHRTSGLAAANSTTEIQIARGGEWVAHMALTVAQPCCASASS